MVDFTLTLVESAPEQIIVISNSRLHAFKFTPDNVGMRGRGVHYKLEALSGFACAVLMCNITSKVIGGGTMERGALV